MMIIIIIIIIMTWPATLMTGAVQRGHAADVVGVRLRQGGNNNKHKINLQ